MNKKIEKSFSNVKGSVQLMNTLADLIVKDELEKDELVAMTTGLMHLMNSYIKNLEDDLCEEKGLCYKEVNCYRAMKNFYV